MIEKNNEIKILNGKKSKKFKERFIKKFIDVYNIYYNEKIITTDSGGYYIGYFWEFIKNAKRVSEEELIDKISKERKVMIFWDRNRNSLQMFSRKTLSFENISFDIDSVVIGPGKILFDEQYIFPEDVYIVDENLTRFYSLTHEHIDQDRLCIEVSFN